VRIAKPENIQYLSLEGGGGKGVAYLGAIRALERMKVLPIDISKPGQNQVKGISGASAGAITALLLAMGVDSGKIEGLLSKPKTFTDFFDLPAVGVFRSVNRQNKPDLRHESPADVPPLDFIRARTERIAGWAGLVGAFAFLARAASAGANDPIVQRLLQHPEQYLYNLVFDRGLFPGFAPRRFFAGAISAFLSGKFLEHTGGVIASSPNGGDVNFDLFYKMTGVDLVITGANVTRHKPFVFSRSHTPRFPVAEAVGISMNLPVLFKPVYVEADVPAGPLMIDPKSYYGFWVDGGLLNNFPLHAYDDLGPTVSNRYPELKPLHPNMLGLRLTEGPGDRKKAGGASPFSTLVSHLGDLVDTVLYPSEQGQIRTPAEIDQTIDLYTYDLETVEFAPSPSKRSEPVAEAERAVENYFQPAKAERAPAR
jgi:NTE family protein